MTRKILYSTVAAAALLATLGVAGPANADVTVTAVITKDVTIDVTEVINVTKDVIIDVVGNFDVTGTAEAVVLVNVVNEGHFVDGQDTGLQPSGVDFGMVLSALIGDTNAGSLSNNTGVIGVNLDVGNFANQANVVAITGIADLPDAFVDTQSEVDQKILDNTVIDLERITLLDADRPDLNNPLTDMDVDGLDPRKTATVYNSVNDNSGVINFNENAGNVNNQTNAVAFGIGFGAKLALAEDALGQVVSGNSVNEVETVKIDLVEMSMNGNSGVVGGNVSVGNMNNQANKISFSALTAEAAISTPGSL
jgi:hypothetical protein